MIKSPRARNDPRTEEAMVDREFADALDDTREVNITTVGRKTGAEITLPVWFVRQDDRLYLLPVAGSGSNWFKNVRKAGSVRVAARRTERALAAKPITDPARVAEVVKAFRAKYGDRDVAAYYPHPDVAVEVPAA
jgi:deazaflavin-dependent oxidoreductase (nitroreductase family)